MTDKDHPNRTDAYDAVTGEVVWCNWTGGKRWTKHEIVGRCSDKSHGASQTGVMFQVSPPVHRPDPDNPWNDPGGDWIDSAWFHRVRP